MCKRWKKPRSKRDKLSPMLNKSLTMSLDSWLLLTRLAWLKASPMKSLASLPTDTASWKTYSSFAKTPKVSMSCWNQWFICALYFAIYFHPTESDSIKRMRRTVVMKMREKRELRKELRFLKMSKILESKNSLFSTVTKSICRSLKYFQMLKLPNFLKKHV